MPAAGADASAQPVPLCQADYSSYSSVFRICGSGGKQRQWFCFEPELVLPEYLVEFEYETASTNLGRELSVSQMLRMVAASACWMAVASRGPRLRRRRRRLIWHT